MFHAWEVKMANTAASSGPSRLPGNSLRKPTTVMERKPRIGTDCRMSSSGIRMRPARSLLAAKLP
jgi:hypothetical protein